MVVPQPIYFITTCTHQRRAILNNDVVASILAKEWTSARERHGWLIGRFVIMPDHVHFFCTESSQASAKTLNQFMQAWKQWTAKAVIAAKASGSPVWQPQFFDHVLRSDESYAEKWEYVRQNPVRAGLVTEPSAWTFQGHIDFDHPHA
ncbi:MAG TPA: transposase [Kiritimatiellia bacterium]|nr:transposase [Kiritimatiellia bacterium]HMP35520.1 transposase [Kiritimatiellia bacterium]